ncbi:RNase P subunit RPR2 [Geoglobus ahangari]|uniref:Ribonuclease P protein component 4 n=1 Tax=Geoglobus ahangari TaxID=113653 RepID=A0A0F7IEU3_9EURY|nr:ribonuclease P [Geoglobus ahangari]AKG91204.1 RNase P subunit RPR2 [Geoglobus ahangari]NOY10751.1 ribonuclease P [Archaeoglobi archaeon]
MAVKRDKALEKRIARERIDYLLNLADEVKFRDYELARRYVELAVRIAKKYRIRLKKKKLRFCRGCLHPYRHDKMRVRVSKGVVRITCLNCGHVRRFKLK